MAVALILDCKQLLVAAKSKEQVYNVLLHVRDYICPVVFCAMSFVLKVPEEAFMEIVARGIREWSVSGSILDHYN